MQTQDKTPPSVYNNESLFRYLSTLALLQCYLTFFFFYYAQKKGDNKSDKDHTKMPRRLCRKCNALI
jgi:hypothetical protein